jgi:hypothetical protein
VDIEKIEELFLALDGKVNVMDTKITVFETVIQEANKVQERLICSIDLLNNTIANINLSIKDVQNDNKTNTKSISCLEAKMLDWDKNSNVSILGLIKQNFVVLCLGIVVILQYFKILP